MIIGSRVGRRPERDRQLTQVGDGIYVAKGAFHATKDSDYFDESPLSQKAADEHKNVSSAE